MGRSRWAGRLRSIHVIFNWRRAEKPPHLMQGGKADIARKEEIRRACFFVRGTIPTERVQGRGERIRWGNR